MNRLAHEKSPYLLQHAANPVDWYPWGEEAFAVARRDDKPIFLSIGYSTCHWCHVMEHESFENQQVASLLNSGFLPIKVDREERPDIDRVYMLFVQATTGAGGWPMSVWLTPDLKPFFGGTYFPPVSRYGRAGFADLLNQIRRAWQIDRAEVLESAESAVRQLRALARNQSATGAPDQLATLTTDHVATGTTDHVATGAPDQSATRATAPVATGVPGTDVLARAVAQLRAAFDPRHAGFGDAPKFPRPSELLFLLRESARTGEEAARAMAVGTLEAMAAGGIRDHIGGGFHRYSVDAAWRVPHFEKMLYDQAQLTLAYLEAAEATGDQALAHVADDTLAYVLRELTDSDGGFYSAEDADSLAADRRDDPTARKSEGAYYVWGDDEVGALLGADADLVRARFGIVPSGNAAVDPHGEFGSGNILYHARSIPELANDFGVSSDEIDRRLAASRERLSAARDTRPHPHLDDKILAAWNGLMIAALARGARVLGQPRYLAAAARAAMFVRDRMWRESDRVLLRRYRAGDTSVEGFAEDYACMIWGACELVEAGAKGDWLKWATDLQTRQDELFWDEQGGGWFSTTGQDPSVLLRLKEDYDGAEPSASAIGVANLLTLGRLGVEGQSGRRVRQTLAGWSLQLARASRSVPLMLANLSAYHRSIS